MRDALRIWGAGLSWVFSIGLGWVSLSLTVQFLDDLAMTGGHAESQVAWLGSFTVLAGATISAWYWICGRFVFANEALWQRFLGLGTFVVGGLWLASSPLFHSWSNQSTSNAVGNFTLFNLGHGLVLFSILGSLWFIHPLLHEIRWSSSDKITTRPRPLWANRWIIRAAVVLAVALLLKLIPITASTERGLHANSFDTVILAILAGVSVCLYLPFRIFATVKSLALQCLLGLLLWLLLAFPAFIAISWIFGSSGISSNATNIKSPMLAFLFLAGIVGVQWIGQWVMAILGFRMVVPTTSTETAAKLSFEKSRPPGRAGLIFGLSGAALCLVALLFGLSILRNNVFIFALFIDSEQRWAKAQLLAQVQAWHRLPQVIAERKSEREFGERILASDNPGNPLTILVTRSMSQSPQWPEFKQRVEQTFPVLWKYNYPLTTFQELEETLLSQPNLIRVDQAALPFQQLDRIDSLNIYLHGGDVTTADLEVVKARRLFLIGCRILPGTDFRALDVAPNFGVTFDDCDIDKTVLESLEPTPTKIWTVVISNTKNWKVEPQRLLEGLLRGISVRFQNASLDEVRQQFNELDFQHTRFLTFRASKSDTLVTAAPPWEFMFTTTPLPPNLVGRVRTNATGRLLGIHWGNFAPHEIPILELDKPRDQDIELDWMIVLGQELTGRHAEARHQTLMELARRTKFLEVDNMLTRNSVVLLNDMDVHNDGPPTVVYVNPDPWGLNVLNQLLWLRTLVVSRDAAFQKGVEFGRDEIEAFLMTLPQLEKLIILDPDIAEREVSEHLPFNGGKPVIVEVIPSQPDWRDVFGLER